MTEAGWLSSADPVAMLEFLRGKPDDRKFRLFTVACCRRVWGLMGSQPRQAVRAAEEYADGGESRSDLAIYRSAAYWDAQVESLHEAIWAGRAAWQASWEDAARGARRALLNVLRARDCQPKRRAARRKERCRLCDLLRDVVGNPFRPGAFAPGWRTDTAVSLAKGMYESRDFSAMPILADALQDAGCDDADILGHCRGNGQPGGGPPRRFPRTPCHVRGCWVVDLVLGRR